MSLAGGDDGIDDPILEGPFGGGLSSTALVAAVSVLGAWVEAARDLVGGAGFEPATPCL